VSYVFGSPGSCYKKSSIAEIRQNSNIWGARQVSGCSSSTNVKRKLHRKQMKRVVRRENSTEQANPDLQKRAFYGPDVTWIAYTSTVTSTFTTTKTSTM
jgi:hypothetical protein